ncbi:MAG TPA: UDP-N-acetylmuramoyl-tripeptide--D-alanyl-D-alanine ligase, partial [Hyphomicrobium sp.]|nr:UDP-N-acetylmuramoyl-tripeptide--D-alanyl-D-alanine ligase [Hyphomicrobium sp.]
SGASLAIVADRYARLDGDGALLRVSDTLQALERIGIAARARLSVQARVVAVTGSAGKTGTKEMLRACFSKISPEHVHASEKSYNNHWGVPLTLARMPASTKYAIFEIGMNHAGEIRPLTKMVRPHAAVITTVEAVHLEHFGSVDAIADAKAEIFEGLLPGGTAILKRTSPHFARLKAAAQAHGAVVVSFGTEEGADVFAERLDVEEDATRVTARVRSHHVQFAIAMPGRHIAENALAVAAVIDAVGAPLEQALSALAVVRPPPGRGARTRLAAPGGDVLLIDESYNANPASMRAALATLATVSQDTFPRRIAVLGDMLELGPAAARLHRDLFDAVDEAGIDLMFACGPHMKGLYDAAPSAMKGGYAETAAELSPLVLAHVQAGDVIMVKASNGTKLGALVAALKAQFASGANGL